MNIQFATTTEYRDFLMNCGAGLGAESCHGDGRWAKLKRIADHMRDDLSLDEEQYDFMTDDDFECFLH